FELDRRALDSSSTPFEPKIGEKPFTNYLQQTLDFSYIKPLFNKLNSTVGIPLKSRGEAHITVISPPEFDKVLSKAGVTMKEINDIALKHKIQQIPVNIACIGRQRVVIADKQQEVYNLILKNQQRYIDIRKDIFNVYKSKGGEGALFQPEAFWGHITLGFLDRDLFIEDGIYKGTNSCWSDIKLL
ncbi:hypothetical protein K502DRAFT_282464, partial [Neoconidiobolus thromboides FSU 785]